MSKANTLLIAILLFFTSVSAQLPELSVVLKPSVDATGIEKARAFYYESDYLNAEALFYEELEKGSLEPHDFLLFSNTLVLDNKLSLATEFLKEYEKTSGNNTMSQQQVGTSSSTPIKSVQTTYPISNPTSYSGKIYTAIDGKVMEYDTDCDGNLSNRQEVLMGITDMTIGSVAFYNNANNAVVSLIDKLHNESSLYLLYKKNGKWRKPVKLFDDVKGNYAFPQIDEENQKLYFSSDRSGGQGGYDLFVSVFNNNNFERPRTLGNEVNTPGNEINPVLTKNWLYFSSDGHASKGGFDIFKFKNLGDQQTILLNAAEMNTIDNEVALLPISETSYYIKRENKEQSRLYSITKQATTTTVTGNVIDEQGIPISGAYVLIGEDNGVFTATNTKGNYLYNIPENLVEISGKVIAEGYETIAFNTTEGENTRIQLTRVKPVKIIKEVIRTVNVAQRSKVAATQLLQNEADSGDVFFMPSNEMNKLVDDNNMGISAISKPLNGLYYIIIVSSYSYTQAYDYWNKWIPDFNSAEILEYENGLYRIGFYAGSSEEAALEVYNDAKKIKKDIWLIRP
jgi:hypothetical protein